MNVLISYRAIPQSPGWATGDFVAKTFEELGHNVSRYAKYYEKSEWIENPENLLSQKYDLLLWMECGDGDSQYYELFNRNIFDKKASWFFDCQLYENNWRSFIRSFDINFCANRDLIFGETMYLPYGGDRQKHYRTMTNKSIDVAIVGEDRPIRNKIISALCAEGIDARLISGIYREDYVDALSKCKLVLSDEAGGGSGLIPMRPYEAAFAGSCPITFRHDPGFGIIYSEIDELISKIKIALYDGIQYESIQQNAFINHSYLNRAKEILKYVHSLS